MPKASSQASKALRGFGMVEGIARCVDFKYRVGEYRNNDGDLKLLFFAASLDYVRCNEQGESEDESQVETHDLIIQIPAKIDGEYSEACLTKLIFHPGKAKSPDDTDPKDLGNEVGTEGNTIYCEKPTAPFADSDYSVFMATLEKHAWKQEINDQSYAPNYIGMVFKVHTETKKLRPGAKTDAKPQTQWVVDEVYVRPYEGTGKKSSGASKPTGQSKTATSTATSGSANGSAAGHEEAVSEGYQAALTKLLNDPAAGTKQVSKALNEDKAVKLSDFMRAVANECGVTRINDKLIAGNTFKEVCSKLKEDGFIEANSNGLIAVDREKKEVQKAESFE